MNVIKAILTALLVVFLVLLAVFITVAIGYYFGVFLTILPLVSGWLTAFLPITASQIPAITAWLAVPALLLIIPALLWVLVGGRVRTETEAGE